MNKLLLKLAALAVAHLAAAMLMAAGLPASSAKRAINPPGTAEGLPFSNAILVGNSLYVAGQEGIVNGKLAEGGIAAQTSAALTNIKKIVEQAGFQMADVVSVTVYMADLSEFGEMNKVYKGFFPEPRPARATVQVAALVGNARVEISAIAAKTR